MNDKDYLRAAFMEVVDNQLRDNDPPETRLTFNRLVASGVSEEDARIYIGQAVCVEIWSILHKHQEFDHQRYLRNLENLPAEPVE